MNASSQRTGRYVVKLQVREVAVKAEANADAAGQPVQHEASEPALPR